MGRNSSMEETRCKDGRGTIVRPLQCSGRLFALFTEKWLNRLWRRKLFLAINPQDNVKNSGFINKTNFQLDGCWPTHPHYFFPCASTTRLISASSLSIVSFKHILKQFFLTKFMANNIATIEMNPCGKKKYIGSTSV